MVSTCPPTSKSSSPFSNTLVTIPNAPITIGIILKHTFNSSLNSLSISRYLSFFSYFFQFYSVVSRDSKDGNFASSLYFLLTNISSGHLVEIRWSVCMSKSDRSLCDILQDLCWVVHIPFVRMVKFKFLTQLLVDHLANPIVPGPIFRVC